MEKWSCSDLPRIAFHTLGCKVNQYDTQAMRELFLAAGYEEVPFSAEAEVYLINTCTVTGTGDRKSLQLARRVRREHPSARLILCGCMAQKQGQARGEVVSLLRRAEQENRPV